MTESARTATGIREFKMPDVGEGLTEAEILKWYVQPGDTVADGQVVCEVETAKAAVELPIPFDGTVHELRFDEGSTVDVGTAIIAVDTGSASGGGAPSDEAPAADETPASGEDASGEGEGGGRQPVLVGYGVSQSSTKRRPRKPAASGGGTRGANAPAGTGTSGAGAPAASGTGAAGSGGPATAPPAQGGTAAGQSANAPARTGTSQPGIPGAPDGSGTPSAGDAASAGGGAQASAAPAAPAQRNAPTPAGTSGPAAPGGPEGPAGGTAAANGHAPAASVPVGRPLAKPPVRKLAKDLGVDLAQVTPTGDGGIVTRDDVMAAAAPPEPEAVAAPEPAAEPAAPAPTSLDRHVRAGETRTPIRGVRKATAQAMVNSAFTAPHVTEFVTVDVTRTMKLVRELKQDPDMAGVRVNPLLLVAKAFLVAIRRHPEVNAAWDEANQEIVQKGYVNLGIAAATPRGLVVPNIKGAQDKTLPELASALGDLVSTAREGKTSPAAMHGGTVTITNVGVFGVDTGTPILNPGESAILAFGQVREQPWVHKGKVKPREVTTLALSFDHRLVDGELGSRVLADVAAVLERPKRLMTWT